MLRVWRIALGPALFAAAGLVGVASEASAQPPGSGRGAERKDVERKDGDRQPGNRVQALERELAELHARTAEVEAQLKKARAGAEGERPMAPMARGPMGGAFGGGGFGPGGPGGFRPGVGPEQMDPEQIKQMIARLQNMLENKAGGGDRPKPGSEGGKPGNPDRGGGASQADILKRLDKLTQELDEIRRSIKK